MYTERKLDNVSTTLHTYTPIELYDILKKNIVVVSMVCVIPLASS